jgi:hypothetical protein
MLGTSIVTSPVYRCLLRFLGGCDMRGMGSGFTSMHAPGESRSRVEPQPRTAVELEILMAVSDGEIIYEEFR